MTRPFVPIAAVCKLVGGEAAAFPAVRRAVFREFTVVRTGRGCRARYYVPRAEVGVYVREDLAGLRAFRAGREVVA